MALGPPEFSIEGLNELAGVLAALENSESARGTWRVELDRYALCHIEDARHGPQPGNICIGAEPVIEPTAVSLVCTCRPA
jgi:hypothetical protein